MDGIEFRSFRNPDPPRILRLWRECGLNRGAIRGVGCEVLESLAFSLPYFDPRGVIIAEINGECVGYGHAGFCPTEDKSALDWTHGTICAVLVSAAHRRRGIGREIVRRLKSYLRERGATTIYGGSPLGQEPFYVGLYGGCRPAGFMQSDSLADPFFRALGFQPWRHTVIAQRDIANRRDPISFRLVNLRRKMELDIVDQPLQPTWWWYARFGRLDTLRFLLRIKPHAEPVAGVSVVGLDHYIPTWNTRAVGLFDLFVREGERRKGYAQLLIAEVVRRMRDELVERAEVQIPGDQPEVLKLVNSCGFERVDSGIIYLATEP